ncbi:RNA polymerase I-specific transcription initiation factor RRN3 homolog Tif-IA isoform X2 [Augochlora pura]
MSVVSSRVSSVSSILKAPGVRSQLIGQTNRVYFKLPKNLKNIIYNFENGNGTKDYEELICILRDSNIKDSDLIEFLTNVRQCISLLSPVHKLLVETLLQIKWTDRSSEATSAYKTFVEDLICMQIHFAKNVIDQLVEHFKPENNDDTMWKDGECKEDVQRLNHIHDVLCKILKVVPMSSKLLLQSLRGRFPYSAHGTHTHEVYIYALLQILEYAPQLRSDILSLIINRLMVLDVNIPRLETDNEDEDLMDDSSECDSTIGVLQMEPLRSLYADILQIFETVILPTHASQYVQYIIFYICSFKTAVAEVFIHWLLRKVTNPNIPSIIRQSSVAYIASFLVTANFITTSIVKEVQFKLCKWIHDYINLQDHSSYVSNENKDHTVFYSVCQALFLIISKRHNDYPDSKKYMLYLQELDLAKIITSKLNPLKACHPEILHSFAEITRMYQLAYCYTIIENNTRSQLPIFNSHKATLTTMENFFPFSSYTLQRSSKKLISLFRDNVTKSNEYRTSPQYKEDIDYMTE